mgnify:CR=1 FL=1|jgi:hypothetical protein
MIYKIIFSITIFILNFLIIKDEIPNYSKEAKIMLLILLLLWFPAFLMEAKIAVNVMMITMLMCIGSSEISVFKIFNTDTFKIIFLLFLFVQCWEMASMLFSKEIMNDTWILLRNILSSFSSLISLLLIVII